MKKTVLVLAVLMLAVPVMASISVTATHVGAGVVNVNYTRTGGDDVNIPRAFALDVNMSPKNGSALVPTGFDPNFYVAPGTFTYDSGTGATNWGTRYLGSDANGFTIEMGSLWATNDPCVAHRAQPLQSGKLFSFTVDKTCTITLAENAQRGGVVMENTTATYPSGYITVTGTNVVMDANCLYLGRVFDANTAGFTGLTVSQAMMDKWNFLGRPNCWCCTSQKRGNGVYTGTSAGRPDNSDLAAIKAVTAWMKLYNQAGYVPCSDVDLSGKIDNVDRARVQNIANWMKAVGAGPPCQ